MAGMTRHLRGRVRLAGSVRPGYSPRARPVYEWSVVNTSTGKVVARDNMACSLERANDEARKMLDVCQEVLIREIRLKHLKEVW